MQQVKRSHPPSPSLFPTPPPTSLFNSYRSKKDIILWYTVMCKERPNSLWLTETWPKYKHYFLTYTEIFTSLRRIEAKPDTKQHDLVRHGIVLLLMIGFHSLKIMCNFQAFYLTWGKKTFYIVRISAHSRVLYLLTLNNTWKQKTEALTESSGALMININFYERQERENLSQ